MTMLRAMTLVLALASLACAHTQKPAPTAEEAAVAKADKALYERIIVNDVPGWFCRQERITGTALARHVCWPLAQRKEMHEQIGVGYYRAM